MSLIAMDIMFFTVIMFVCYGLYNLISQTNELAFRPMSAFEVDAEIRLIAARKAAAKEIISELSKHAEHTRDWLHTWWCCDSKSKYYCTC